VIILFPLRWIVLPIVFFAWLTAMLLVGFGGDHWLRNQLRMCAGQQTPQCASIRQQAAQRHLVEKAPP
jgi:hypothetical protein